jgi:serine/threonine protein kinase
VIGQLISHYQIIKKLGAGGMGEVYLGEDVKLDRKVAIKFLPSKSIGDETAHQRLLREARAAATLDHPNICSIYEVGEENGQTFIVMQYIEGETLDERMRGEPLDLQESLPTAAQIADALVAAHERGVIHRDIKPSNIILTERGQVKVLDFGLAKVMRTPGQISSEAGTERIFTSPGMIIGTVPYMSPKQVRGEALDARSDIFSFGVVLYEMLGGKHPFAHQSAAVTISAILTQEPPPLKQCRTDLPTALESVVQRCLEKDRERRYQAMRDVALDLERISIERQATQIRSRGGERRASSQNAVTDVYPAKRQ